MNFLTNLLNRRRRVHDARPHQQARTARIRAKLLLHWYRDGIRVATLAPDRRLRQATVYHYLTKGIEVLAATALQFHEVLEQARHDRVSAIWCWAER